MKLNFLISIKLFLLCLILVVRADLIRPKPWPEIEYVGDSKILAGETSGSRLSVNLFITYQERLKDSDQNYEVSYISRIEALDLINSLNFKKRNKKDITYDDLRTALINQTHVSSLTDFLEDSLDLPMCELKSFSVFNHSMSSNRMDGNVTSYRPTSSHYEKKGRLASVIIPTYVILAAFSLLVYAFRRKFFSAEERLFKFSNVSRLLCQFLLIRLVYDVLYLIYLILFIHYDFFASNSFLYLCFLLPDEFLNAVVFYFVIAIFVKGYMTLSPDRKILRTWDTVLISALYFVSVSCLGVIFRYRKNLQEREMGYYYGRPDFEFEPELLAAVFVIISKIVIMLSAAWMTYVTYKETGKNDKRYIISIVVIAISYYFSSFISIPRLEDINQIRGLVVYNLLSYSRQYYLARVEVPEIVQIAVCCWLIYYWRDRSYKKLSTEEIELA